MLLNLKTLHCTTVFKYEADLDVCALNPETLASKRDRQVSNTLRRLVSGMDRVSSKIKMGSGVSSSTPFKTTRRASEMVKNSLNCVWDTGTGLGCRTLACTEVLP